MSTSPGHPALARRLGTLDATVIGVGSMVGAGVFVAFAPAAGFAGPWLPLALLLAAVVAWCNATSTAQLAAVHPASGGTYVYANRQLGPWPGFVAGWGFVTGKTASAAAMALTFGLYAAELTGADDAGARLLAVAAVLGLTAVNLGGVTRTARLTRLLVAPVLVVLLAVVVLLFSGSGPAAGGAPAGVGPGWDGTGWGVLPAAGTLFFAFAGYARVATMGEEVRDPARTIPRAVLGALAFTLLLYGLLGLGLLRFLGVDRLAASAAPWPASETSRGRWARCRSATGCPGRRSWPWPGSWWCSCWSATSARSSASRASACSSTTRWRTSPRSLSGSARGGRPGRSTRSAWRAAWCWRSRCRGSPWSRCSGSSPWAWPDAPWSCPGGPDLRAGQEPAARTTGRRSSAGGDQEAGSAETCSPERMSLTSWASEPSSPRTVNHT
jgi:hypothetical protein